MTQESAAQAARETSDRAFNRMYLYLGGWMIGALFILFQYHLSEQSTTSLVATLGGLAVVTGYCSVSIFKTFRAAIFATGSSNTTSASRL